MGREIQFEIIPRQIQYACDKCGRYVYSTGMSQLTNPPKHQHQCPGCETVYYLPHNYPYIKWIQGNYHGPIENE